MDARMNTRLDRSTKIKWIIVFALTVVILLIPEQGIYNYQLKVFLAVTVFALAVAAFELAHTMFVAFIMPVCWILFGVAPASVVMSPWLGTTFLLVPGALFLAATLEDCGLLQRIAYALMCQVKGSYFGLLFSIMIVGIILNILSSGQGYLIVAALAAGLCAALGGMNKRLGAGLATAVMLGGCTAHAYTYQAAAWAVILPMGAGYISPTDITPLSIMLHCWPLFFISLLILFIVSKWYKPEEGLGEISYFQEHLQAMGKITRREIANIVMLAILLIAVFTVNLHKIDLNLCFGLIPWMVYLPFINGADSDTIKKMNVTIIFFVAACMSIGTVAGSLGIGGYIAATCETLLAGNTTPMAIMGIVFGIVFLLNFLMTPMAIFALVIEPICMLAANAGFSAVPFAYAVNACSEAIILPYEYVPYLIVFSFGMISTQDFIKVNILRSVIFFGGFLLILVPYWMLIGLF